MIRVGHHINLDTQRGILAYAQNEPVVGENGRRVYERYKNTPLYKQERTKLIIASTLLALFGIGFFTFIGLYVHEKLKSPSPAPSPPPLSESLSPPPEFPPPPPPPSPPSWIQKGSDIDSEFSTDQFGWSTAISDDGNIIAAGAPYNDGAGAEAGHVRVYNYTSGTWTQLGDDIDGEAAGDNSGNAIAISSDGHTIAVGAYHNAESGTWAGHLRVYQYNGTHWAQQGQDIDGGAQYYLLGASVSISSDGHTVAAGQTGVDYDSGIVQMFSYNSSGWYQKGDDILYENPTDVAGRSVSLSGDGNIVAIGANQNGGGGYYSGHVRVFSYNSSGWTQVGSDIDGELATDQSGMSVSISESGNIVAIGAPYALNGDTNNITGHARVYNYTGSDWAQMGGDIDGQSFGDQFGGSVSLSAIGTLLAVGAKYNDGNGTDSGHTRLYTYDGSEWSQSGPDIEGESDGDYSGGSVALSGDGGTVIVGATRNEDNGSHAGHVRVYLV